MKKSFKKIVNRAGTLIKNVITKIHEFSGRTRTILAAKCGEGYVDTGVKILIAVVLGALILGGLYSLFSETVLPSVVERVTNLFNYVGK